MVKHLGKIVVLFWVLLFGNQILAQQNYKTVRLTVDDGLINGNIHQISQDNQGFIWIATENGLVRYDGFDYKVYQTLANSNQSISHNFVHSVCPKGDNIWVGTMSGVDCFNPMEGNFSHFHFYNTEGKINMKPALRVFPTDAGCFVQSDDKYVYYAEKGDDTLREVQYIDFQTNEFVSSMDKIDENNLIVGNKAGQVFQLSKDGVVKIIAQNSNAVSLIKILNKEKMCVCYEDGEIEIYEKLKKTKSFKQSNIFDTYVNDIEVISDSLLLVGTRSHGLYALNFETGIREVKVQNIVNKNCSSIYKDCFGNIWVGHSFGGITIELFGSYSFDNVDLIDNSIQNQKILSQVEESGNLYIGTDGGGLFVYNKQKGSIENYTYESGFQGYSFGNAITSLVSDGKYIWIGTFNHGIYALSLTSNKLSFYKELSKCPAKDISSVYADSQRNIWIGTYASGVYVFNRDSAKFIRHYTGYENDGFLNISCDGTICFYEDIEKNVWIGSYYGISKIFPDGESKIYRYDEFPGMRSSVVTSISQTKDGKIWFGSLQGLGYYNPEKDTIIALNNVQIANNIAVCGIIPQEDSTMIVVTPKNSYLYNPAQNEFQLISTLNKGEMQRNSFCVSQGKLLIGTDRGIKSIPLPIKKDKENIHGIRLTDVLLKGESAYSYKNSTSIRMDDGKYYIELPYNQKDMIIKFSDFYFDQSRTRDFSYKMKGFSDRWVLLHNENEITYTNLPGGDYVLYVKHLNNETDPEMELHIHIAKALWERTEFYVVLVLVLIAIICFVFIQRMQRMIRMRNILKKQVDLKVLDIKRKTEQIELQNVQMKLQRDAATRQRSESEKQREGIEKKLAILSEKNTKNEELLNDFKQKMLLQSKEKLALKRRLELYENTVQDVVFRVLLPSEKVEYVSPSVLQLTGYAEKEFVDGIVAIKDLMSNEIKSNSKKYRKILLEGQIPEVVEIEIYTKDGIVKTIRQFARYETNLNETVTAVEFLWTTNSEIVLSDDTQIAQKEVIFDLPNEEYDWSDKTILVCDYDDDSYRYIYDSLASTRINVVRAENGVESVEKFMSIEKIDVILVDILLPQKNGYEVVQEIRKENKVVPIIAQTQYGNYEAKLQCFDVGCDTYIAKPYKMNELRKLIMKYLDKR
ncbi:MAG: response regulator [Bacteroidales bacterium]|nr:response regulator [Bacteroidales bacterium]